MNYEAMNEVIPGLWVGDMTAAGVARELLEEHNIKFIISAMRGRVKVNPVSWLFSCSSSSADLHDNWPLR